MDAHVRNRRKTAIAISTMRKSLCLALVLTCPGAAFVGSGPQQNAGARRVRVWTASPVMAEAPENIPPAAKRKPKKVSESHKEYLAQAAENRRLAQERRQDGAGKFWRKKKVYDFVRLKQQGKKRDEAKATRWARNITAPMETLLPGQWLEGRVRNLQDFGAWVDVGAERDGLLHVRDMSEGFTTRAADVVTSGDYVNVTVKFVDAKCGSLALSLVPLTAVATAGDSIGAGGFGSGAFGGGGDFGGDMPPLAAGRVAGYGSLSAREPLSSFEDGDELWGEVVKVTNFGAFVECGAEVQGFLHVLEHTPAPRGALPADVFWRGQRLRLYALEVDPERRRLKLTTRRPEALPPLRARGERSYVGRS
ncbi:unnamed protein product, partial [Phaeothamnion confervicola]